jgi:hypothetical protein
MMESREEEEEEKRRNGNGVCVIRHLSLVIRTPAKLVASQRSSTTIYESQRCHYLFASRLRLSVCAM